MFARRQIAQSELQISGRPARPPEGTVVFAVGDVHGRRDLLARLRDLIATDRAAASNVRKVVVYLGDYVDRGIDSKGVIDLLLDHPLSGFQEVFLRGNHEDMMLNFLDHGPADPMGEVWLRNGGIEALESYGIETGLANLQAMGKQSSLLSALIDRDRQARLSDALNASLPASHRAFLDATQLRHREGDYLFVHAGIAPDRPLEEQFDEDLMWIRGSFLADRRDHGAIVVHGHSITERPVVATNRIGVDTGAFMSDRLTAAVIDAGGVRFLST